MEVIVTGSGWAILFYGWWFLGEGLSLDKVWDTMFMLSGAISWVSKQAQLNANTVSLQEAGSWLLRPSPNDVLKLEDLDILTHIHLNYHHLASAIRMSPHEERGSRVLMNAERCPAYSSGVALSTVPFITMRPGPWPAAKRPLACSDPNTFTFTRPLVWEWWKFSINFLLSVIKVQWTSGLQASAPWLMLPGAWGPHENQSAHLQGWRQEGCHHLSKLALGYNGVSSSWVLRLHPPPLHHLLPTGLPRGVGEELRHWHHFGVCDCCAEWALQQCQGPGCLEPGAFPTMNCWQRNSVRLGGVPLEAPPILVASFQERFPLDHIAKLKWDCFYGGLPKQLKVMVAYLKATTDEKTYSDHLQAVWETEKEEMMETSWSSATVCTSKLRATSFSPLQKLKGSQWAITPSAWMAHLEEKRRKASMVRTLMALKAWQKSSLYALPEQWKMLNRWRSVVITDHCDSPDHFIHDCPWLARMKADAPLNWKEGMVLRKGQAPQGKMAMPKVPRMGSPRCKMPSADFLLECWPL